MCLVMLIHTDLDLGLYMMDRAGVGSACGDYTHLAYIWGLRFTALVLLVPSSDKHVSEHLATYSRTLV